MSSQGDCGRESNSRRCSGVADDGTHGVKPRNAEGFAVSPLECDVRTSIGATASLDIAATAPSSPDF